MSFDDRPLSETDVNPAAAWQHRLQQLDVGAEIWEMPDRKMPTADDIERSRERSLQFAKVLLTSLGPVIDQMRLTQGEVGLGLAYILGECLSHVEEPYERTIRAQELHDIMTQTAQEFVEARRR